MKACFQRLSFSQARKLAVPRLECLASRSSNETNESSQHFSVSKLPGEVGAIVAVPHGATSVYGKNLGNVLMDARKVQAYLFEQASKVNKGSVESLLALATMIPIASLSFAMLILLCADLKPPFP